MNRTQLDGIFIQSVSYYINGFNSSKNYTSLSQMGCTIDYDENGHTILTSWTETEMSEPSIEQLLAEDYEDVIAYWNILMLPQSMSSLPSVTTTEGEKLATLGTVPNGAFCIINNVLNVYINSSWVAV